MVARPAMAVTYRVLSLSTLHPAALSVLMCCLHRIRHVEASELFKSSGPAPVGRLACPVCLFDGAFKCALASL